MRTSTADPQLGQGRVAGAEVVDREAARPARAARAGRVGPRRRRRRSCTRSPRGSAAAARQPCSASGRRDLARQVEVGELAGRQVDRGVDVQAAASATATSWPGVRCRTTCVSGAMRPVFSAMGMKRSGRQEAAHRVLPAHQRLDRRAARRCARRTAAGSARPARRVSTPSRSSPSSASFCDRVLVLPGCRRRPPRAGPWPRRARCRRAAAASARGRRGRGRRRSRPTRRCRGARRRCGRAPPWPRRSGGRAARPPRAVVGAAAGRTRRRRAGRRGPARAPAPRTRCGDLDQQQVADVVAERVVDLLEVVEVGEHHGERARVVRLQRRGRRARGTAPGSAARSGVSCRACRSRSTASCATCAPATIGISSSSTRNGEKFTACTHDRRQASSTPMDEAWRRRSCTRPAQHRLPLATQMIA